MKEPKYTYGTKAKLVNHMTTESAVNLFSVNPKRHKTIFR